MRRTITIAGFCIGLIVSTLTAAQAQTATAPRTWAQFVEQRDDRFFQVDYTLPDKYRNGYVYFDAGANQITAFILRQGLAKYPPRRKGLKEILPRVARQYVKSGKAIVLNWNLGNQAEELAKNPKIRKPRKGTTCLRITCLTAPYMSHIEAEKILRSEHEINR